MKIDKNSPVPLHYQLEELIEKEIESGILKPGERLMTEEELCRKYSISRTTVRTALKDLENKGLIRRERRHGTFVQFPKFKIGPERLKSFTEDMRDRGLEASSVLLERKLIVASEAIAKVLGLSEGEQVVYLKRLRLAGGEPMGVQEAHLPYRRFPKLLTEDDPIHSLYEWLRQNYGVEITYARETYRAVPLGESEAKLLGVPKTSPAFYVERVGFDERRDPVEFVKSIMRADRYEISINLFR